MRARRAAVAATAVRGDVERRREDEEDEVEEEEETEVPRHSAPGLSQRSRFASPSGARAPRRRRRGTPKSPEDRQNILAPRHRRRECRSYRLLSYVDT
ncbi:uncharacterized protein LOC118646737 isoform X2 [Monomorium pharaonis]|nr:uncharacterized protein LOC118646737 isoform X2 [Monomorium pharaonis]